jgi:Transmembrane secretion effector
MTAALRHRDFRWLFGGQVVSGIGDQLFPVAVTVLVVDRGGSAGELGLVLAARFAALVLFALLGGVWADRLPRVSVLQAADALRLVAVLGLVVISASSDVSVPVLAAMTFVVGAGEAFFRPAYGALLPTVLPEEDLPSGNALSASSFHAAQIVGPGLGGLMIAAAGAQAGFVLDAVTFGVSLLTLFRVAEAAHDPGPRQRMLSDMHDGVAAVRARPWVGAVLLLAMVQLMLAVAPSVVLLPLVVRSSGLPTSTYGLVLASSAVGGLLGAALPGRLRSAQPGRTGLLGLTLCAAQPLALLAHAPVWLLCLAWGVSGLGLAPFIVYWESALQVDVPRALLARVVSLDWMCSFALLPLGLALVGPVTGAVGRAPVLVVAVVAYVVPSLLVLRVPGAREFRTPAASVSG